MNMKKLMAVVLAVVLAISAMAVNVFAAEGEVHQIPLRPNQDRNSNATATYEMQVPMYNMYGYAEMSNYLELYLPNTFTDDLSIKTNVDYYLEASGEKVLIAHLENWKKEKQTDADGKEVEVEVPKSTGNYADNIGTIYEQIFVNFGAFKRDWNQWASGADKWATVPQTVSFNTTNSLKLTAKVTLVGWSNGGWIPVQDAGKFNNSWEKPAGTLYTQLWTAGEDQIKTYGSGDDVAVTGSKIWAKNMSTTMTTDFANPLAPFKYLSTEATADTAAEYVDLTWDMTLVNRSYIMNAESVDLVVKFYNGSESGWIGDSTYGTAMYRLYMADTPMTDSTIGQSWWNLNNGYNRKFDEIAYQNVNAEEIKELRFAISPEKLVNLTYGFSAGMTSTFRIFAQYEAAANNFYGGNQYAVHYNHWSNNAYLEVTMPAADDATDLDVEEPVQSTDDEPIDSGDDVTVNEPTDSEPEDTNPPTGIVLAVLPMVVAAAAVVASKRR